MMRLSVLFRLMLCLVIFRKCSIRGDASEDDLQKDFELKPQVVQGIEKLRTMLLDDIRSSDDILSNEIMKDFYMTLKACQKGMEEAADEVTHLLEILSDDELPEEKDDVQDEKSFEVVNDILTDDFSDIHISDEEKTILQENYVKGLRKVFKTFEHACSSLPKALPKIHSRKQRNPQTTAQRLALSLKRWSEKWIDLVEYRLEEFLLACMKEENCKHYFHKVIKMIVDILEEYQFYLDKDMLSMLQEFQSSKDSPSMNSLNYAQRLALAIGNSFGTLKEDDEAYHIASGIHNKNLENSWFDIGHGVGDNLIFLSNIFHRVPENIKPKAIVEIERKKIVQIVPKTFLSAAFGTSIIQDGWKEVKTQKDKFVKIVSALSPALIRMGGSGANFLSYDPLSNSGTNFIDTNPKFKNPDSRHPKIFTYHGKGRGKRRPRETPLRLRKGVRNQYKIETNELYEDVDRIFHFDEVCEVQYESGKVFTNFTMTRNDYRLLIDIVRQLGWELVFDLNQFWRTPNGDWDPTNAKLIIDDPYSSEVPVIWQIGNEPNNYNHHFNWSITPEEAVKDYKILNKILRPETNLRSSEGPLIIGPDVTRPTHYSGEDSLKSDSMEFLETFLSKGMNEIDAVTWHQYYFAGKTATLEDFLSPDVLNAFPEEINVIIAMSNSLAPDKPVWITETATAWGGGAPGLSTSFAACFPWLDKLGAAAIGGVSNVFRQTLYGGCYALLDEELNPYPDYWASVLHKKIVGQEVLLPRVRLANNSLRVYAHCLERNHELFKHGSIVIIVLNLSNEDELLQLIGETLRSSPKYLYELSAPNGVLTSRNILLNKEILTLNNNGSLPELKSILMQTEDLVVSPWTLNFWVIPDAEYDICS